MQHSAIISAIIFAEQLRSKLNPEMTKVLRQFDLNLLPLLQALLRNKNVTRAGAEVGLSQSAMSHALIRLREVFSDPLLVPSGREFLLTRRAQNVLGLLDQPLKMLEQLLVPEIFDAKITKRRFRILGVDYISALFLPSLLRVFRSEAPNADISVIWEKSDILGQLRANQVDIALLPRHAINGSDVISENIYFDDLVVIVSQKHSAVSDSIDLETFRQTPYVMFKQSDMSFKTFAEQQLLDHDIVMSEVTTVSDFLTLALVVEGSNCVALVHRRFAEKLTSMMNIRLLPPPFPTQPFFLDAFWHQAENLDPGHQWFRKTVRQAIGHVS